MIRWQAFATLCRHLRSGLLDGVEPLRQCEVPWERLVEVASHEYVTPALAWCLRGRAGVPQEVQDYLARVLALNSRRNRYLLDALALIVEVMNENGIEPVLLKGAARLVEGCYPEPSARFLGDLDILIPAESAATAELALRGAGFEARSGAEATPHDHHHLPMLHHRETGAGVELHTAVTARACAPSLPTDYFLRGTRSYSFRNGQVGLPDATRSIAAIVVHDQLQHELYGTARFQLRQLLDLAILQRRHGQEIDWAELDRLFRAAGQGTVLATYLRYAQLSFGQRAPLLASTPRPGAMKQFGRNLDPAGMRPRKIVSFALSRSDMQRGGGHCWIVELPRQALLGDIETSPVHSLLEVFEDERPLGPAHCVHDVLRTKGQGGFSHWGNILYFSSSDNSDPRTSGRAYRVSVPAAALERAESAPQPTAPVSCAAVP